MNPGVVAVFIPIVAIVMSIGIGMQYLWSEHKRKTQLLEQNHRERMQAIEKGVELPPVPLSLVGGLGNAPANASAARALRNGIMLTLIGILLFFGITIAGGPEGALFGLIPAAVGVANLIYAGVLFKAEKEGRKDPG